MLHAPLSASQAALPVSWTWGNAGSGFAEQWGGHRGGHTGSLSAAGPPNISGTGRVVPDVFLASCSGRPCRETFGAD